MCLLHRMLVTSSKIDLLGLNLLILKEIVGLEILELGFLTLVREGGDDFAWGKAVAFRGVVPERGRPGVVFFTVATSSCSSSESDAVDSVLRKLVNESGPCNAQA